LSSRILVLENKTLLGRFISQTLSQYQYHVTSVSTAAEIDARLGPRVDCLVAYAPSAARWSEQIERWRRISPLTRIVVVSEGLSEKGAGLASAPDAQVGIPFQFEKLVQTVERCLARPPDVRRRKRRLAATA
jgi:DNA-binding NtrC family response regulator